MISRIHSARHQDPRAVTEGDNSRVGRDLLSVGAAYGVLVAVFQWGWASSLLGFQSNGGIAQWLPMFMFVILFGLSMDYQVFIVSRIREAYDRGMKTGHAVEHGITTTAGVFSSAALVMVGVFAVFAVMPILDMKEMGIGLAAAVLTTPPSSGPY